VQSFLVKFVVDAREPVAWRYVFCVAARVRILDPTASQIRYTRVLFAPELANGIRTMRLI